MSKKDAVNLNASTILAKIMDEKGYTYDKLAKDLGYAAASGVSERMRSNRFSLDVFYRMVEEMGCEIIVKSKTYNVKEVEGKKIKEYSQWKIGEEPVQPKVDRRKKAKREEVE